MDSIAEVSGLSRFNCVSDDEGEEGDRGEGVVYFDGLDWLQELD